ncbi:MAG TPA: TetR/AcrR family transcriptional regulator C-terminal domain-containing protein [Rhodanobacteraceae bacterium]|nr:TetR/AcrR family transcriptional regulator C-terminal domain-containing protein [Rhodanobacteraceae bacterium]
MRKLISRTQIPASGQGTVLQGTDERAIFIPFATDPETIDIEIDANGSPVTLEAADWLVCFVPGLRKQWWHGLVDAKHKHVFAMRMVDENTWLIMEPWWTRNMVNVLSFDQAVQFLRWAAAGDIIKVREAIPGHGSQTRGWSNCAVLVSFMLGRRYRTWSPHGLYKKLKAEQGAEVVDVSRLLVEHCTTVAIRTTQAVLGASTRQPDESLESILSYIGQGIVHARLTPAVIGIHKAAAAGSHLFKGAAEAYWANGPERVIERIRGLLEEANRRREINIADSILAARRFVAMLRNNLHRAIGGCVDAPPPEAQIHDYVKSIVTAFLHGASDVAGPKGSEVAFQKELVC